MKIIKNQKSKFGNFDLLPDEGWKLHTFLDYRSNLLIASESKIDLSDVPSFYGMKQVPTKQYVIHQAQQTILTHEEWKTYFNYETAIRISDDGKLKEVMQRKYDEERDDDFYEGYLIDIETGQVLNPLYKTIAFRSQEAQGLIESHYENEKIKDEYQKTLQLGEYPDSLYQKYLSELTEGTIIIEYRTKSDSFSLKIANHKPSLFINSILSKTYDSVEDFWGKFSTSDFWNTYKCTFLHPVLQKFMISSHNKVVKERIPSFHEYELLHSWMNLSWNEHINKNAYWQFCPRCHKRVMYNPRYPKQICVECYELEIVDEKGFHLSFSNEGISGGFVVTYYQNNEIIKETHDEGRKICYIEGKKYIADEARFGGIVIQMADE